MQGSSDFPGTGAAGMSGSPAGGPVPPQDAAGAAGGSAPAGGEGDAGGQSPQGGGGRFRFSPGLAAVIAGMVWALVELWLALEELF